MSDPTKGRLSFITGSTLVKDVVPGDRDMVVRCTSQQEALELANPREYTDVETSMNGDPRFVSYRDGDTNYILVWTDDMFFKFEAFSGALKLLQLKDKADRIKLAKACLYGEIE